jgi:DNA-3-methyladenine glycosylase
VSPSDADAWRAALERPVEEAAIALLGARLHSRDGITLRIVETEAYGGVAEDAASHAHRGATPRTAAMFGPVARLYVYRSYGIHLCVNIVCHPRGAAGAVLLRAAEVTEGEELARQRRHAEDGPATMLASGPGRLGQALGVTLDHNGCDLLGSDPDWAYRIAGQPDPHKGAATVLTGARVGISRAAERPWRFWLGDSPAVSRPR